MPATTAQLALGVVNRIPAMVAYWDRHEECRFSNEAYREWFGRGPEEMIGMTLKELLGPLYELNRPHIRGALAGKTQEFERQINLPNGTVRSGLATYIPDVTDGVVQGFWVHVADISQLRAREAALQRLLEERDSMVAELQVVRSLLPICAHCKKIRDTKGEWLPLEAYLSDRAGVSFTHGFCPHCAAVHYPPGKGAS